MIVTRFAPSPTGHLHLGHAYSAFFAESLAFKNGGRFLLRIEDIDTTRCRPEYTDGIIEDLSWLGIRWDPEVVQQSDRMDRYAVALENLRSMGLVYPCFCSRKEIEREMNDAGIAPHGSHAAGYPGTCRSISIEERERRISKGEDHAWRLDSCRAGSVAGKLQWTDRSAGTLDVIPSVVGDVIIARKDIATSYHLAVTLDDADQGVTLVTRGNDLMCSTHIHRLLQALLSLPVPQWHHHKLISGSDGERFSKRKGSMTLKEMRESGMSAEEVRRDLGF